MLQVPPPALSVSLSQYFLYGEDGHLLLADWTVSVAAIEKKKKKKKN